MFQYNSEKTKQEIPIDVKLIRHQLASIDLSDVRDKVRSEAEYKEFLSQVASFFPTVIEPEIKQLIINQEEFMAREVANTDQFNFARGTINGLILILEKYQKYFDEYLTSLPQRESIDKTKLFPEI